MAIRCKSFASRGKCNCRSAIFRNLPEAEREASALAAAAKEASKPYVMSRPVLRPRLMRLSEHDHLLLIVTHAVACDAISTRDSGGGIDRALWQVLPAGIR